MLGDKCWDTIQPWRRWRRDTKPIRFRIFLRCAKFWLSLRSRNREIERHSISSVPGFQRPGFSGLKVPGFQGSMLPLLARFQGSRAVSGFQGSAVQVSSVQGPGLGGSNVPGFQGSKVQGCRAPGFQRSSVPASCYK